MKSKFMILALLAFSSTVLASSIVVPNGDFETMYKPGTSITGAIAGTGWTMGVGPDCEIDGGTGYEFSDGTTGLNADIPGWIGYDMDSWIALGGSYGRDETTGNYQGAISNEHNATPGGTNCYLSNGGAWGNPAGGLITSDAPLASLTSGIYTLSMVAKGGATPVVLDLLANGIILLPSSTTEPVLTDEWQVYSKTYDLTGNAGLLGQGMDLTIVVGVGRGATGGQTQFDNLSLSVVPEPATMALLGLGGLGLIRRRRNG